jgi:hypothetical protein
MPLGNGDIGVNAWIEPDGDLVFYVGKGDTWSDNGRLLKVGKLRIKLDPPPSLENFEQRLSLQDGTMAVRCGQGDQTTAIHLWVDANHPVIRVSIEGPQPCTATASIELWRTEREPYPACEVSDLLEDRSKPNRLHEEIIVEPDTIIEDLPGRIGWYHHNIRSVGPELTARLQGLWEYFEGRPDPLLHRTFGAVIAARDGERIDSTHLRSPVGKKHQFSVFVLTEHPSSPERWLASLDSAAAEIESQPLEARRVAHERWWSDFWNRSWIHVSESSQPTLVPRGGQNSSPGEIASGETDRVSDAFVVSRAYALQRFIDACAGRGRYPIKFNGSIFTVPHEGKYGDADYRRWGPGYWWQNTRLPYLSMCASGDFEMMRPLFRMYAEELMPLHKFRTRKYTGHDGAFIPECIYFWGPTFTATYGWTAFEQRGEDKLQESGWHKWEWVSGPELVWMMLDYYEHTLDEAFARNRLLPTVREVLTFFDQHYETDTQGKLLMCPSQAVETWWNCTNPMPEIAGLHAVTARLLLLPEHLAAADQRAFWGALRDKLPVLPTREVDGVTMLAPAETFDQKRNIENPELYAVFPFRLVSFDKPNAQLGIEALKHRWDKGNSGWRQDDLFMAYLGLAAQTREYLVGRAHNKHRGSRFPAFWGPNYDWIPDQDHGGVLMRTLQAMLMQTDGKAIHLLPAWPRGWDADFKLYAPYRTIVSGSVRDGRIESLKVEPESRRKDLVIHEPGVTRKRGAHLVPKSTAGRGISVSGTGAEQRSWPTNGDGGNGAPATGGPGRALRSRKSNSRLCPGCSSWMRPANPTVRNDGRGRLYHPILSQARTSLSRVRQDVHDPKTRLPSSACSRPGEARNATGVRAAG